MAQDTSPNTIYIHADILTGAHLKSDERSGTPARVTAMAVTNSTIVGVGSDDEMLALRGEHTQVVDLGGAFVMPGFNDAHTHIASAGQQKLARGDARPDQGLRGYGQAGAVAAGLGLGPYQVAG
jgi:predicted amidohydrolase YtcJ